MRSQELQRSRPKMGQVQMRGQGHVQSQGGLSQPNKRKTFQQMVNLPADILRKTN